MEKKKITEVNAVAAIMDSVFQQVETHWYQIWGPVEKSFLENGVPLEKSEFIRFNYSLAALAINFRSTFDLFPRSQAERLFTYLQQFLHKQLGNDTGYAAVRSTIQKYIEAYNAGILKIHNPIKDVATLLYYKIGLDNTEQTVVDESFFAPDPTMVDYLTQSLTLFLGKWDMLLKRFEVISPHGDSDQDRERRPASN